MSRENNRSGRQKKPFLIPLLVGVSVFLASTLGIATNIATDLLPQEWEWPKNPNIMWLAVLGLTLLGALIAWFVERLANRAGVEPGAERSTSAQARQAGGTIGDIRLNNSRIDTFIGNINTENLKIYNARDLGGDPDSSERRARLSDRMQESNARLVDRWMAVGLSESIAEGLASDESVGAIGRSGSTLPNARITAIVGEFGSGKSVSAERLYQDWIQEAIEDESKPIPVFLEARFVDKSVDDEIRRAAAGIGSPEKQGVRLVLDGLDEPGPLKALDLLSQTRRAIRQWPNSQALITVRPGLDLGDLEIIEWPPMTPQEIHSLLERIGANPGLEYSESASIREALQFPLFAIIAAVLSSQGVGIPRSRGAFLEALAARALGKNGGREIEPLRNSMLELALLSISTNSRVPIGDVGDLGLVEAMCATRLVTRRGMTVSFSLPIFEQYFAGQAILRDGIPEDIISSPAKLSHWQDALALGISMGSWSRSSQIIEAIAKQYPGIASSIVMKAVPAHETDEEAQLPADVECGKMLRRALGTWTSELAPLGPQLGFTRQDGSLTALAVSVEGPYLTWGIVSPEKNWTLPDVVPVSVDIKRYCSRIGSEIVFSPYAAWPWRWSLSQVTHAIEGVLKLQALDIPNNIKARQERDWALAKALLERSGLNHQPVPLDAVREAVDGLLSRLPEDVQAVKFSNRRVVSIPELMDFQRRLSRGEILSSDGAFVRPYPTPDISPYGNRWIWEGYSQETLRTLVEEVYTNALHIYEDMVSGNFPKLLSSLGIGAALPLLLDGVLTLVADHEEYSPSLYIKATLLDSAETSRARIRVGPEVRVTGRDIDIERASVQAEIKKLRPAAGGWLSLKESWSVVDDVFGDTPAIDQAYRWLWDDLRQIGLAESLTPLWFH